MRKDSIYSFIKINTMDGEPFEDNLLQDYLRKCGKERVYSNPDKDALIALGFAEVAALLGDSMDTDKCGATELDIFEGKVKKEANPKLFFLNNAIIENLKEEKFEENLEKLEEFFDENKEIRIIHNYEKLESEFSKITDEEKIIKFAKYVIEDTQEIEAIKYVLVMLNNRDFSKDEELMGYIKRLALCIEFTYYAAKTFKTLENGNSLVFEILKKIDCTKEEALPAIAELEAENDEIKDWIVARTHGYIYKYRFMDVLEEKMQKTNITVKDFERLSRAFREAYDVNYDIEVSEKVLDLYLKMLENNIDKFNIAIQLFLWQYNLTEKCLLERGSTYLNDCYEKMKNFAKSKIVAQQINEYLHDEKMTNNRYLQQFITKFKINDSVFYSLNQYKKDPIKNYNLMLPLLENEMVKEDVFEMFFEKVKLEQYDDVEYAPEEIIDLLRNLERQVSKSRKYGSRLANKLLEYKNEGIAYIGMEIIDFNTTIREIGADVSKESLDAIVRIAKNGKGYVKEKARELLGMDQEADENSKMELPNNLKIIKDSSRNLYSWNYYKDNAIDEKETDLAFKYWEKKRISNYSFENKKIDADVKDFFNDETYHVAITLNEKNEMKEVKCTCNNEDCVHFLSVVIKARKERMREVFGECDTSDYDEVINLGIKDED